MLYQRGQQGIWWYRFRFGGRMVHESAKTTSKTMARDAERARHRKLELNYNKIEKPVLPPTLIEAAKVWLAKRVALADSTRETYEAALKHVKALLGTKLVCEITSKDIASYQKARLVQGAAGATINKEMACLSSILSDYGVWAQVRRDVKRLEENKHAGKALSRDEEKALLDSAANVGKHQGHWSSIHPVTVLGLNTGLRHLEVRNLRWKNVDLEKRVLVVGESKTEAGSRRPVPLTQPAWAILDFWASRFPHRKPDHFVFPACETGHIDPERPIANWRTAWHRACRETDLAGLRYHDCRHSAATKLLEQGTLRLRQSPKSWVGLQAQQSAWQSVTAISGPRCDGRLWKLSQRPKFRPVCTKLCTNRIVC